MDDYYDRFYNKLTKRSAFLRADNFAKAKSLVAWKENMVAHWDEIQVVSVSIPDKFEASSQVGETYKLEVEIDVKGLNDKGIGVELVAVKTDKNNETQLYEVNELSLAKTEGTHMFFSGEYQLDYSGSFKYAFRMFPKNEELPHRQDFCYVRWF